MKLKQLSEEGKKLLSQKINEYGPWFHNIEIAKGVYTNPDSEYASNRWKIVAPFVIGKVRNKVCLDVGCSSGFFSIKLIENGARKVIGIDQGEQNKVIEQARFATNEMGIQHIEHKTLSVYDVEKLETKFDFTLFLGVLYHLRYPLLALDKLRKVTDKMIIQTITTKIEEPQKKDFEYLYRPPQLDNVSLRSDVFYKPGYPKIHFIENELGDDISNKTLPNVEAVTSMLRASGFKIEKILFLDHEMFAVCS